MGQKEDEAADFLLKMLSGEVKVFDVNDEDPNTMNRFKDVMEKSENIQLDEDLEKEYQQYIKESKENGYAPVSRAEFLAVHHATQKPKNVH